MNQSIHLTNICDYVVEKLDLMQLYIVHNPKVAGIILYTDDDTIDTYLLKKYNININYFEGGKIRTCSIFNKTSYSSTFVFKIKINLCEAINNPEYLYSINQKMKTEYYITDSMPIIFLKTSLNIDDIICNNIKNIFKNIKFETYEK